MELKIELKNNVRHVSQTRLKPSKKKKTKNPATTKKRLKVNFPWTDDLLSETLNYTIWDVNTENMKWHSFILYQYDI